MFDKLDAAVKVLFHCFFLSTQEVLSASLPHMVHITGMLHLRQNMSLLRAHNAFCSSLISCVSPAGYSPFKGFSGRSAD